LKIYKEDKNTIFCELYKSVFLLEWKVESAKCGVLSIKYRICNWWNTLRRSALFVLIICRPLVETSNLGVSTKQRPICSPVGADLFVARK